MRFVFAYVILKSTEKRIYKLRTQFHMHSLQARDQIIKFTLCIFYLNIMKYIGLRKKEIIIC